MCPVFFMHYTDEQKKEITSNLAAAMGPEWKVSDTSFYDGYINGTGYQRLRINFNYNKVYAVLPENKTGGRYDYDHIGCNLLRPSKALAQDIKRRLMPGYIEQIEKTRRERFEYLKAREQSDLVLDAVSRFYPVKFDYRSCHSFHPSETVSCRIETQRGRKMLTFFGLSDEQLIKLVANLKGVL